jgi:hypothetical protein
MNSNKSERAWLFCEGTDEQRELSGNRSGFEQLHSAIGALLSGDANTIRLPDKKIGFSGLELRENPPSYEPLSSHDRRVNLLISAALISIALLAFYGFIQLVRTLSS